MESEDQIVDQKLEPQGSIIRKGHRKTKSNETFDRMVLTYYWSLAANRLSRILVKHCREPLHVLRKSECSHWQSTALQTEQTSLNTGPKHLRILSDQLPKISELGINLSPIGLEQISKVRHLHQNSVPISHTHQMIPTKQFQRAKSRETEDFVFSKSNYVQSSIAQIRTDDLELSNFIGSSGYIRHLKLNDNMLDLFTPKVRTEKSKFGQLSPDSLEQQRILKKKISDGQNIVVRQNDVAQFMALVKRDTCQKVKIIAKEPIQQYNPITLILILILVCSLIHIIIFLH